MGAVLVPSQAGQAAPDQAAPQASPAPVAAPQPDTQGEMTLPPQTPESSLVTQSKKDFVSGEGDAGLKPSSMDQFFAGLQQTSDASPIGFMLDHPGTLQRMSVEHDMAEQNRQNGVLKISPDEANKKYPGMPVPFNEPVDPYVADLQYSDFQRRQKLAAWKDRGGPSPYLDFASGIAGGFADPLNMALGLATGGVSRLLPAATTALGGVARVFGENLAINVATGIPSYFQEKAERQDVSMGGAAKQAVEGAIGGTLFHYTIAGAARIIGMAAERVKSMPKEIREQAIKDVLVQHENDAKIDTTPAMMELRARENGDLNGDTSTFKTLPVDHPSQKAFYGANHADGTPVQFQNLGPGRSLVEDGMRANNMVSNPGGEPGHLGEFRIPPDAKMLDLDQPAHDPANEQLTKAIQALEEKSGMKLDIQPGESIKDVLARINDQVATGEAPPNMLRHVQDLAKEAGFAGYKNTLEAPNGKVQDALHLFDENHLPVDVVEANQGVTPTQSEQTREAQTKQLDALNSKQDYTPELEKDIRDMKHGKSFNSTPDYMDPIVQETYDANMAKLEELAKTNPRLAEELAEMKQSDGKTTRDEKTALQAFADCITKDIS